jgi:hypothetical protein
MIKTSKYSTLLLFSIGLVVTLSGCSTLEKNIPSISSIFTKTDESVVVTGVYYSGSPDLPLYRNPGGVIVKRLPQYTKLNRDALDRGFAHVRVDSTGETGWVENAKLLWRLPKSNPSEQTHQVTNQPAVKSVAPQVTQPAASPLPQPVEAPELPSPAAVSPSKPTIAPSIFNPY